MRGVNTLPPVRSSPLREQRQGSLREQRRGWLARGLSAARRLAARGLAGYGLAATGLLGCLTVCAQTALPALPALPESLAAEVQGLARQAAGTLWGESAKPPRIEVVVGRLDPRLKLAPCQRIEPYLPAGARPLGQTRMGLRCVQGATAWNISLPIVVRVWAPSLVAASVLPVGTLLEARHLVLAEVDLAARADPAINAAGLALGRTLARGLASGEALRQTDLKTRLWFNAGDTVRIVAIGPGYAVSSEGQAMGPGLEGQSARVRTEGGRVVSGIAVGERRVEVAL